MIEAKSKDGKILVELEDIGEGINGDYTGEPDDVALLRFTVYLKAKKSPCCPSGYEPIDDGSYCTQIPVATPKRELGRLAQLLLSEVEKPLRAGESTKRLCERLSWINPTWGTKEQKEGWVLP